MIRALLFDFDGTILDTESCEYGVWREVYADHGCDLPLALWCDCVGRPNGYFDPYTHLETQLGRPVDRDRIRARRRDRMRQQVEASPVLPGIEAWLDEAGRRGMQTAIVSSSTHEWVHGHLVRLGLSDRFQTLVCREDTDRHKPDPAPYLEALARLGVNAAETAALEDSAHGVNAAASAGIFTIAVPNPVTRRSDFSRAHLRCDCLSDLPLPDLLARWGANR